MKIGKKTKRGLALVGGLVLLFGLAHTPPARSVARMLVERFVASAADGSVSLARLDYRLWRGEFELSGFSLQSAAGGSFALRTDRVLVTVSLPLRLSAEVDGLDVVLLDPSGGEGSVDVAGLLERVRSLTINDGTIRFRSRQGLVDGGGATELVAGPGDDWLTIAGVEADLAESGGEHRLVAHAASGLLNRWGAEVTLGALDAEVVLSPDSVRVVSASLLEDSSFVRGEGELGLRPAATGAFDLEFAFDSSLARLFDDRVSLTGIVAGRARVDLDTGRMAIDAELSSDAITSETVAATDVEATIRYENQVVRIERLAATSLGGSVLISGDLDLRAAGAKNLELVFNGIDMVDGARQIAGQTFPFAARVEGDARLRWVGWQLEDASGDAAVRLEAGAELEGAGRADLLAGVLRLEIDALAIPAWRTEVSGRATVSPMDGTFEAVYELFVADVGQLPVDNPVPATGALQASGRAAGTIEAPEWTARVTGDSLQIAGEQFALSADVQGAAGSARLLGASLEGAGGVLSAEGTVPLNATQSWAIGATARNLVFRAGVLDELASYWRNSSGEVSAADPGLQGSATEPGLQVSEGDPGMQLTAADLGLQITVDADLQITGAAEKPRATAAIRLPSVVVLDTPGRARASIDVLDTGIQVRDLEASFAGGALEASGTYAFDSSAIDTTLVVRGLRIGELPVPVRYADGIDGVVEIEATIAGTRAAPNGIADLSIRGLSRHGLVLPGVDVSVTARDGHALLEAATRTGDRFLSGELLLRDNYPLYAELELSPSPLAEWVTSIFAAPDAEGDPWTVAGTARLDMNLAEPGSLVYTADVDAIEARLAETIVRAAPFRISGNTRGLRIDGLELDSDLHRLSVDASIPLAADQELDLVARGELDLALLAMLDAELSATGQADIDLTVTGPITRPRAAGKLTVRDARGAYGELTWSSLNIDIDVQDNRRPNIVASGEVLGGTVELSGELPVLAGDVAGFLDLDVRGLELANLLSPEARASGVSMQAGAGGRIDVPSFDWRSLSGNGDIFQLDISSGDTSMVVADRTTWRLADGALSIPSLRVSGDGASLELELTDLRPATNGLEARGRANGLLYARMLNPLLARQQVQVRGTATFDVDFSLEQGLVTLGGSGALREGRFTSLLPPFSLANAELDVEFLDNNIRVSRIEARSGAGTLRGSGNVDWSNLEQPLADLRIEAQAVPVEFATGIRAEVSGDLRVGNSSGQPPLLSGSLTLDRGLVTREFDGDDNALSSQSTSLRNPGDPQGLLSQLGLDLLIATARNIHIENSTARLEVAGNVSLRGTAAAPEAGGFLTVVPDGTFNIGANRLQLTGGRVDLSGFPLVQPYLDIDAIARVGNTRINVSVVGFADDLRTTLTAPDDPELTEGDLASLLVTGRTLENAGEGGAQIASAWAMSSLAGLVHEGLADMITFGPPPGAGPMILAEEADPTARLSFGFPVTERLSVTYSIGLDSTERRMFILDYQVARNIWLRAIQENSADYGFGISQRFEFNLWRRPSLAATRRRDQRVASVSIAGGPADLAGQTRVQQGDRYDYWSVRDDASRLRDTLRQRGYVNATVDATTAEEAGDAIAVTYEVDAGEPTTIVWRGDDPGTSIRGDVEDAWDGRVPEEFLIADATLRTRARLRAERFFAAEVTSTIEPGGASAALSRSIVFDVEKGTRGKKVVLTFAGNSAVSDAELRAALPATNTEEFFLLLERPAELERGLRLRYAADGYLDATSAAPQTRIDAATGTLAVEVPVREGSLLRIAGLGLGSGASLDPGRIEETFAVAPGSAVDFPAIRAGETRLRELYRAEGFSDVRVRSVFERTENGLDVELLIDEGTRARVGEIRVVGNVRTLPHVILNEVTFGSGDPIRLVDFQRTQKRLYDLAVFRSADVRADTTQQGQEIQDVVIQVVERADIDVAYGARYNFIGSEQSISVDSEPRASGFQVNSRINLHNPFRRATSFGFSVFYQGNYQLLRSTFRMPTFFRRRIVTELIGEVEREKFVLGDDLPSLESSGGGITFQQTKKLTDNRTDKFALQWNFRYAKIRADRYDDQGERRLIDAYRPRFGISLIEDRRDSFANPTRGRFWNVTTQVVPKVWGSDVGYVRFYGQGFFYFPLTESLVWASGVRAGVSSGSEEFLLIDDRFQTGGANSVRGYRQNTLGPAVFIDLPDGSGQWLYIGGQSVAVINQELRFPIWNILHGAVFWDAGNVWAKSTGLSLRDLKHSVGAGLRVVLPFGALRFDFAEPLNRCSLEELKARPLSTCAAEVVRFHFSFGYAF